MCAPTYEQVEELLAARFPKPDVRDLIRRLPGTPHIGTQSTEAEPEATETRQIALAPRPLSTDADHRSAAVQAPGVVGRCGGLLAAAGQEEWPVGINWPRSAVATGAEPIGTMRTRCPR